MLVTSSQAHKLTSFALLVTMVPFLIGCQGPVDVSEQVLISKKAIQKKQRRIDLGIIFANEANYACFSLEKLGIHTNGEIVELTSSCRCVEPSIFRCEQGSQMRNLIRFDFAKELKADNGREEASLSVKVDFKFANGDTESVFLDFLRLNRKSAELVVEPSMQVES